MILYLCVNDIPVHTPAQWASFGAARSFLWWHLQAETPLAQVPVFPRAFLICSISWKWALLIVPLIQTETHALSKLGGERHLIPHTSKAWEWMSLWSVTLRIGSRKRGWSPRWVRLLRAPGPLPPAGGSVCSTERQRSAPRGALPALQKPCKGVNAGAWHPRLFALGPFPALP